MLLRDSCGARKYFDWWPHNDRYQTIWSSSNLFPGPLGIHFHIISSIEFSQWCHYFRWFHFECKNFPQRTLCLESHFFLIIYFLKEFQLLLHLNQLEASWCLVPLVHVTSFKEFVAPSNLIIRGSFGSWEDGQSWLLFQTLP